MPGPVRKSTSESGARNEPRILICALAWTTESYSGEYLTTSPPGHRKTRPDRSRGALSPSKNGAMGSTGRCGALNQTSAKKRRFCSRIHATASSAVRFVRSTAFGTGFMWPGRNSCHHALWRLYMFPHMRHVRRPVVGSRYSGSTCVALSQGFGAQHEQQTGGSRMDASTWSRWRS